MLKSSEKLRSMHTKFGSFSIKHFGRLWEIDENVLVCIKHTHTHTHMHTRIYIYIYHTVQLKGVLLIQEEMYHN